MSLSTEQYSKWEYVCAEDSVSTVFPDGCRDILIVSESQGESVLCFTDWDVRPRAVYSKQGRSITGFRLRPGFTIDPARITECGANGNDVKELIEFEAGSSNEAIELVEALSDYSVSLLTVAKQAGVSVRTVQRYLKNLGLPKPEYWRMLSRARMAALAISNGNSLLEISQEFGYSDQAHMTREFTRWFGQTPAQLRTQSSPALDIDYPGLGNWTSEQISIK